MLQYHSYKVKKVVGKAKLSQVGAREEQKTNRKVKT